MDTAKIKAAIDSFLDNKVARLNKKHKIAIFAAAAVLPVVVFYFLLFVPKAEEITGLEGKVASMKQELAAIKKKAAKIEEQKALKEEMRVKFLEAALVMPDSKEIPSLLTSISDEGAGAGLEIVTFTPGGEAPKEFYAEIPVSLSVKGTYHNVGFFLDRVSKLPRIVNVVNISLGGPSLKEGYMLLTSQINLKTYTFKEPKTQTN